MIGELDPYRLGATSSAFGRPGRYGHGDDYVARTANGVDVRLARALTGGRLVVVVGPSKAGKTRTLFEAVRAHESMAHVVWPVPDHVSELAVDPRILGSEDTLVVWLDDLHEYLTGTDPLTPAVLARLGARRGRTLVVATLRSEMRAQLRGEGELRREIRMLFEQACLVDLASTGDDPAEHASAARTYPGQLFDGHGLGEVLAGAPELLARYDDARAADPLLHMVIAVAIDWARIGRRDPIPEPVLIDLTVQGLRATRPDLDTTSHSVLAAITTARTPPRGAGRAAALRTSYFDDDIRGYRAFDYLLAVDDGQDHRARRPIPDAFWHTATRDTTPATLRTVGYTAYLRADTLTAHTLLRQAAEAGDADAKHNLGVLLTERGELAEAETWYRRAADTGHLSAMTNLGVLLKRRGELVGAETWYRRAADTGHLNALHNLGFLLHERGELAEAETWLRQVADTGHTESMTGLGFLLKQRGELAEAETWLRRAADTGHTGAMTVLAILLSERGEVAEAETWYRQAADTGHTESMTKLGVLLSERGDVAEAETWYRQAADTGHTDAMTLLGILLSERRELAEAETWYRQAADTGDIVAMTLLGILLAERGEVAEAETWYRQAADTDNVPAMTGLGDLLKQRGELAQAETWYRWAAAAGNTSGYTSAMHSLGVLLIERGEVAEAETWYRRAADTGDTGAMTVLGILLAERGEVAEAETWYRRAADTGHTDAMTNLGVLLTDRGELTEAETWFRRVADTTAAHSHGAEAIRDRHGSEP
ncbi:tetratricopeptide repeat protein [Nocardia xishanensis]|uniref:tetratricopeptide repeat protein n=1 Tax=Nocardia xishanensis TaxID=238964 RepID=UPI0033FBD22D